MKTTVTSPERQQARAVATANVIRLVARPTGLPTVAEFEHVSQVLPPVAVGQVLVRNLFMSVDPSMRGRMNQGPAYVPAFEIGKPLEGRAVGEVLTSRTPEVVVGDIVQSMHGWRDYFVAPTAEVRVLDRRVSPLSAHLGVLGMPGLTAWIGLKLVDVRAGDTVFVSGAAGAVGSLAGQLAKLRGCFVVGSAGSDEKARAVTAEFGFDAAFNYRRGDLVRQLATVAPDGIDVYFDNVGGNLLEAAMASMRNHGRIAACGSISSYNDEQPSPGPKNMFAIVTRRLTMRGFITADHMDEMDAFVAEVSPLLARGTIKAAETVVQGLENAPQALIDLLAGANTGKMVVAI